MFNIILAICFFASPAVQAKRSIHINKEQCRLQVIDGEQVLMDVPVCLGANYGQKTKAGDRKTPEGDFTVWMIQPSSTWTYDYGDGKGKVRAYGPWFIRLRTPMSTHIGIHGTIFPETMGKRASEGCIRLRNEDLVKLKALVYVGMPVHITKDDMTKVPKPLSERRISLDRDETLYIPDFKTTALAELNIGTF